MRLAAFALSFLIAAPMTAWAQTAPSAAPVQAAALDPAAVVAEVRSVLAARYVLPERRPALDAALAEGLAAGRYAVSDPATLAERINEDLKAAVHDEHLGFRYDPRQATQLAAMRAAGPSDEADFSGYMREVRAANHGVTELRLLSGNVRLMRYDGFEYIGPETDAALTTAMQFLAGGDAVIIDLRTNGGGSPEAVQQIISRFLPAGTPLMTFYMNGEAGPDTTASLPDPLEGRMIGKPLYVLTSEATASAAEEFTGHVLGYRLGDVVGVNTAGAGFRNEHVAVDGGFVLSVSVGRAVLAATGKDWEAVGFAPTLPSSLASAENVAHMAALRKLAETASPEDQPALTAAAEALDAQITPRAPTRPLDAYAGQYGERSVRVDNGALIYQRTRRATVPLIPLGGDRFAFETDPMTVLTLAPDAMTLARGETVQGRYDRTGD